MSEAELPSSTPGAAEVATPAQDDEAEIVFSQVEDEPEAAAAAEADAAAAEPTQPEATQSAAPELAPVPEAAQQASGPSPSPGTGDGLSAVLQIPIVVEIVLGSARMTVSELAALGKGSKIPLDRKVGEPVDVVVNGRIIAHGTVVMLDDGTDRFGISLDSLASQDGQGAQGAVRSA